MESFKLIPKELTEIINLLDLINNSPDVRTINQEEQGIYKEACKQYGEKARSTLNIPIEDSNLFKVLLLNQIGIRTATLPELGIILESNPEFLSSHYEEAPSVVLRSKEDFYQDNNYLINQLSKDLKIKNFKVPLVINGLKIKEDNDSVYGLSFNAKEAQIIKAPELKHSNNQKTFSKLNEKGMPIFDEKATKTLYTRDNGLSRLYLDGVLDLVSEDEDLAGSDGAGRVVIVSSVANNLDIYSENKKAEKQRYKNNLTALRDQINREIKSI